MATSYSLAKLYAQAIMLGERNFASVPNRFKIAVAEILIAEGYEHLVTD